MRWGSGGQVVLQNANVFTLPAQESSFLVCTNDLQCTASNSVAKARTSLLFLIFALRLFVLLLLLCAGMFLFLVVCPPPHPTPHTTPHGLSYLFSFPALWQRSSSSSSVFKPAALMTDLTSGNKCALPLIFVPHLWLPHTTCPPPTPPHPTHTHSPHPQLHAYLGPRDHVFFHRQVDPGGAQVYRQEHPRPR